jgi:hypothetical protein
MTTGSRKHKQLPASPHPSFPQISLDSGDAGQGRRAKKVHRENGKYLLYFHRVATIRLCRPGIPFMEVK